VDNFSGVVMFVDFIMLLFLTVVSLGNVLNMMRRVRQGEPREPRDLIVSTSLMLAVGIGGIIFMLWVC
jgi:putative copper export protein